MIFILCRQQFGLSVTIVIVNITVVPIRTMFYDARHGEIKTIYRK